MKKAIVMWGVGTLGALLGGTGCMVDATGGEGTSGEAAVESVGEVKSPFSVVACDTNIYDACYEHIDSSGFISIRYYTCKLSALSQHPTAECPVEDDRVLIGGGAQIDGSPSPGAMLVGSHPPEFVNLRHAKWSAESADHIYANPHRLRAYAIGMRLAHYTTDQLANVVKVSSTFAFPASSAPVATISVPHQGDVMLGGGAYTAAPAPGQLLVASTPASTTSWVVKSKDHIQAAAGFAYAYIVSMPSQPPGLDYSIGSVMGSNSSRNQTGYTYTYAGASLNDRVVTGIGGETTYSGWGRLLVDLYPSIQGSGTVTMRSKDHGFADSGSYDYARYIAIYKK
jgi:hypothetical protein